MLEVNLCIGERVAKRLRSTPHCEIAEYHCGRSHSRPDATQLLDGEHQHSLRVDAMGVRPGLSLVVERRRRRLVHEAPVAFADHDRQVAGS